MCGVIGVIHADSRSTSAAADLHDALYLLQHRGQDACGIAVCASGGRIFQCKGNGMASKVFHDGGRVKDLPGFMGLGHLRYPTAGSSANAESQPFYVNSPHGICFAHNGNLINAPELKRFLDQDAHRHINTDSDSELMLNVFANELNELRKARINAEDCFVSLERTYRRCNGGWACTAMIAGFGLLGFRDPYGIRPLCLGKRIIDGQADYMIASESVALQYFGCDMDDIVDVLPGQAVIIEKYKRPQFRQVQAQLAYAPDIFEYVYFSRPDTVLDGISVQASRANMGRKLAATIIHELGLDAVKDIHAVIPIPETATVAARKTAEVLKKPLIDGFIKNRYVFRTFIMPTQKLRRTGVRRKLNAVKHEFRDKNVLLIDDSIVRGTTSEEIVAMAREAGARKVYLASCAPPIRHIHLYGIDLATQGELIASQDRNNVDIARRINADAVVYQNLADLEDACAELSPRQPQKFEVGVFCGKYITPVEDAYFEHLEKVRGERRRGRDAGRVKEKVANGITKTENRHRLVGVDEDAGNAAHTQLGASATLDTDRHGHANGDTGNLRVKNSRPNNEPANHSASKDDSKRQSKSNRDIEETEYEHEEIEEGEGSVKDQAEDCLPVHSQDISLDNINDHLS